MIGKGSLAHNRREFFAENVDPDRVQLNICYQNENLKEVYKELFDDAVERYNTGKRKDRKITNYYEKIRQGKQEKLFHEVIFQIGNREDMAVGTEAGNLAVNVLDEYVKDFQKWNPTLRVFSCYLHQDEATPHLHIDFIPYVTGWKGKGMDTRVSLKQALKGLGFQGGNKHDTELNQWINHEKEVLAEIARQYGIEWEQKGTHEEHLDVYNFKKKERKKEVQELEQEKEHLTAEKEELTAQIAESRADIQNLKDDKEQAIKAKQEAEQKAGSAEKELKSLEDRREQLQPIMDSVSKEIKEYGTVKMLLPEAGTLERAVTYRDKKIKPLFLQIKNKVAVMAAQVKELTKEVEGWKKKYQKVKQKYNAIQRELDDIRKDNQKLSEEKDILQGVSDRYDRVVRVLGIETADAAVQQDIQNEKALEEKQQLHCGLQTLFDNAETAAVPVSAGGEYAMLFYDTAANTARQTQSPLAAQLAAILCGQAHRLDCTLPDDLHLAAKAAADVQVLAPGSVRVNLTLRDVELKDLTPTARPDAELQVAFAAAANREFDGLITALYGINGPDADPLDLCFWLQNRYGSTQGALRAELTLHWHRPGEG